MRNIMWSLILFSAVTQARSWKDFSDPSRMSKSLETHLSSLPVEGEVSEKQKYWSGDFWAFHLGSINYRWNQPVHERPNLRSPLRGDVLKMSSEELARLSPSEKFDLLNGSYHYPLKKEVRKLTSSRDEVWEGLCQGWSAAALHHAEPTPKILLNPDGVEIPFGSSDIKGLLSYFYAYKNRASETRQIGLRCSSRRDRSDRCEEDTNAGAFHLLLTNLIGHKGQSFIADIEKGPEVWNHIPVKYSSNVLENDLSPEADSAPGTVYMVRIKTEVMYLFNSHVHTWHPLIGTPQQVERKKIYEYMLDLSQEGEIIGGRWITRSRPDYLWHIEKAVHFYGMWRRLKELLND